MTLPPPTPAPRLDRDQFVGLVLVSGLIAPDELDTLLADLPPTDRAKLVARHLVEKNALTVFQAERLLAGRSDGFVIGSYRILDVIGRGGMGRVYKAVHRTMGRVVALKILNPQLMTTERVRKLFAREVKAAGKLRHPNIVTAFDANQTGDRAYLVMEYVEGRTLQQWVRDHGPLPPAQACDFARQTALGLSAAHQQGMVHRDIKPANLLATKNDSLAVQADHTVKILDFGLARLGHPGNADDDSIQVAAETVMGTPDYLSPEQARSLSQTDARSDIYSLGCTLYFMLTGRPPFPGGSSLEKMVRHTTEDASPVSALRPEVSAEVSAIVARMMAKKPEDRFQTCDDVAAALLPHAATGSQQWVVLDAEPATGSLASGVNLSVGFSPMPDDPWSDLASAMTGTDSGQNTLTAVAGRPGTRSRRPILMIALALLLASVVCGAMIWWLRK